MILAGGASPTLVAVVLCLLPMVYFSTLRLTVPSVNKNVREAQQDAAKSEVGAIFVPNNIPELVQFF